ESHHPIPALPRPPGGRPVVVRAVAARRHRYRWGGHRRRCRCRRSRTQGDPGM
ncbi:MAG: hypothetical protein AVDCRST_MAG68-5147, partial [uncultured Gemmatimonadetes bacterium]